MHQLERKLCIPFPGDPMRPGTLMGPPRRGNRPWAQGEKGAKGILDQHVKKADVHVMFCWSNMLFSTVCEVQ